MANDLKISELIRKSLSDVKASGLVPVAIAGQDTFAVPVNDLMEGAKGAKGDTGEQGVKGDKGDAGEQGVKGDKGDKGEQGEKGDTGEQGVKGDKGDAGDATGQGGIGVAQYDIILQSGQYSQEFPVAWDGEGIWLVFATIVYTGQYSSLVGTSLFLVAPLCGSLYAIPLTPNSTINSYVITEFGPNGNSTWRIKNAYGQKQMKLTVCKMK